MLCCLYKNKRINALHITEEATYAYRKEIKLASSKRLLICEDCGSPMVYKQGAVMTPHFAHWVSFGEKCEYHAESESLRKCKYLFYSYFKKRYPTAQIELEYRALPSRRSDVYIQFDTHQKLVIDFEKYQMSTANWVAKQEDYQKAGLSSLWIVNGLPHSDRERHMPFFEQMMLNESNDGIALFLTPQTAEVLLIKKMVYQPEGTLKELSELFEKVYPLNELVILPNGHLNTPFHAEFEAREQSFLRTCAAKTVQQVKQNTAIRTHRELLDFMKNKHR